MIDDKQYHRHIRPVLNMLARRKYPGIQSWCDWFDDNPKCHICEYSFRDANGQIETGIKVQEHGYQHLKEMNLLPFI